MYAICGGQQIPIVLQGDALSFSQADHSLLRGNTRIVGGGLSTGWKDCKQADAERRATNSQVGLVLAT